MHDMRGRGGPLRQQCTHRGLEEPRTQIEQQAVHADTAGTEAHPRGVDMWLHKEDGGLYSRDASGWKKVDRSLDRRRMWEARSAPAVRRMGGVSFLFL